LMALCANAGLALKSLTAWEIAPPAPTWMSGAKRLALKPADSSAAAVPAETP
jgi:hypothetical protein